MTSNLGGTTLKRRQRSVEPMRAYDALPHPLRQWLAGAVLPWSAASSKRIWIKALRNGQDLNDVLSTLARVEQKTLVRGKHKFSSRLEERGFNSPVQLYLRYEA